MWDGVTDTSGMVVQQVIERRVGYRRVRLVGWVERLSEAMCIAARAACSSTAAPPAQAADTRVSRYQ